MLKRKVLTDHTMRRLAFVLVISFLLFETWVIGAGYSPYFLYLLDAETPLFIAIACLAILLSYFLFYRFLENLLASSAPFRAMSAGLLAVAVIVEYGYQKALGRFTDRVDIETAIAATPEQQMTSVLMYLEPAAVIPVLGLLLILIFFKPAAPRGSRPFLIAVGSIVVSFALLPLFLSQKFPTSALNAFIRTATEFTIYGPISSGRWATGITGVSVQRREVPRPPLAVDHKPSNNIVIIIDESIRGDHLSLNGYARDTTPFLRKLRDNGALHNWGIAAAASTGSRFAYSAIITGLGPDDFPDRTDVKVNTFPTLFQYARAMGYRTWFFDGQMHGYWGTNPDDKNYFDHWLGVLNIAEGKRFETWEVDAMIAVKLRHLLETSNGNLVLVFKRGSHIPYHSNFPPDDAVWSPSYAAANKFDIPSADLLPQVTNAYDNAIRHNTDGFFRTLLPDEGPIANATIIYTGDHGQTLFAGGRSSHGGNTKAEANVPLFIIGKFDQQPDTAYLASHGNIFPSVLDLMSYPEELREARRFPSLLTATRADSRPRYFNPDLGTKVPFD